MAETSMTATTFDHPSPVPNQRRRRIAAGVLSLLVLTAGVTATIASSVARSSAGDDLARAEETLAALKDTQAGADSERAQAEEALRAATSKATTTAGKARSAASAGTELADLDRQTIPLRRAQVDAIRQDNVAEFNRLVNQIGTNLRRSNPLLDRLHSFSSATSRVL